MTLASVTPLDPTERAAADAHLMALVEKMSEPAVADALTALLGHADLLAMLVQMIDGILSRSEEVGNSLIELFGEARTTVLSNDAVKDAKGFDMQALASTAGTLSGMLPQVSELLPHVAELATPGALEQVALLTRGLEDGAAAFQTDDRMQVSGVMSAMRLFKDPDVCTAVSFFATVARSIGREVGK